MILYNFAPPFFEILHAPLFVGIGVPPVRHHDEPEVKPLGEVHQVIGLGAAPAGVCQVPVVLHLGVVCHLAHFVEPDGKLSFSINPL